MRREPVVPRTVLGQGLVDWAVPWVMVHAEDMVVAEPLHEDGPGYYGLAAEEGSDADPDADESA